MVAKKTDLILNTSYFIPLSVPVRISCTAFYSTNILSPGSMSEILLLELQHLDFKAKPTKWQILLLKNSCSLLKEICKHLERFI